MCCIYIYVDYCRLRENVILATNLDIVCLCETFLRNSEAISLEGYKWIGHNRTNISRRAVRGSGGVGVLVKESMFDRFSIDIVDKRYEDILWITCTQLNNPENVLFICVCYLPPAASSRGDRSHDVFDILRSQCLKFQHKGEILICGDFNARIGTLNDLPNNTSNNLPQRQVIDTAINSHGKQLVDFLIDCNMITLNGRFCKDEDNFTVISTTGKSVVDYALIQIEQFQKFANFEVKTVLDVLESFSIPTDSSMPDHSLICWEYICPELPPNLTPAQPSTCDQPNMITPSKKYRRDPNKPLFSCDMSLNTLDKLTKELDLLDTCSDSKSNSNELLKNYTTFYSLIENEYHNRGTKTHHSSSRKPWWSPTLESARKNLRKIQKAWTREQNREEKLRLWEKFKKEQRNFNHSTRKAKRHYLKEKQIYLLMTKASNVKKFWKEFNSIGISNDINNTALPNYIEKEDGTLTTSTQESLTTWRAHFNALLNPPKTVESVDSGPYSLNTLTNDHSPPTDDDTLNRPIEMEEVQLAIAQLQDNKSPGPDHICPSIIKDDIVLRYLHKLFQRCFESGTVPPAWLNSTLQPIYKGKGNKHDPNNYRGITLQSCIAKAFAKVINNRLGNYLEANNLLHEEQNGFRKGRSCQDHISSLYFIIENRLLTKQDTYTCFVDFRKAFDSVPRDLLWKKLLQIGIKNNIHNAVKALYTNTSCTIKVNNNLSLPIPFERGVKQGCPLSPTLFNIFINDLIDYLNKEAKGITFGLCQVNALLYADDLVLMADKPETLSNLLQALNQWCTENNMGINPDKTKIIYFRHPKEHLSNYTFTCGTTSIDYTDNYKYLGIDFTEHLRWTQLIQNTSKAANRAANYLIAKARNSGALVYEVYTYLYNMLVLPIIEYSSFLWGYKAYSDIEKIQNNLMRSFMGVGRNAPIAALIGDMGWLPIATITKINSIRFWLRLSNMTDTRLNKQVFNEASKLASNNDYHNWIAHIIDILKADYPIYTPAPTLSSDQGLQYYREHLIKVAVDRWQSEIAAVPACSESGGRLVWYRQIKNDPSTEIYLTTINSLEGRRVMMGLRAGCLPLAVEVGRYTGVPYRQRVCRVCGSGEVEDQIHFLINCPKLNCIRQNLFSHCLTLSSDFIYLSDHNKCAFLLCVKDIKSISLILQMYHLRQSLLCRN